jgi:hypothetical protein
VKVEVKRRRVFCFVCCFRSHLLTDELQGDLVELFLIQRAISRGEAVEVASSVAARQRRVRERHVSASHSEAASRQKRLLPSLLYC